MRKKTAGQIKIIKLQCEWVLNNFCTVCYKVGDEISSPVFSHTNSNTEYKWQLLLYPKSCNEKCKDYVSIFLQLCNSQSLEAIYEISILNSKREKFMSCKGKNTFVPNNEDNWGIQNFLEQSVLLDPKNDLIKNDKLLIYCEIRVDINTGEIKESINKEQSKFEHPESFYRLREFDDYDKLLDNNEFSDVIIQVNEKKFYAHKNILANKSSVFAAMFQHDMKEKQENIIEITDVGYEECKEMLRFIYGGKVSQIQKFAKDLLILADKYDIEGLKFMCERTLCKQLCSNNAVKYLSLADFYNASTLKIQSINFITKNVQEIRNNPEFLEIANMNTGIIFELFRTLASEIQK